MCWLVYAISYIARGNFSFARSIMIDESVIGVGIAGIISAVYFISYAVGQLVNGILADKKSPFVMVTVGLLFVMLSNFAMALSLPPVIYCVLWGINGFGQSMLWSPIFFIMSNILNSKIRFFAVTVVSLCTPFGKMSSSVLSGIVLRNGVWQNVFYMASIAVMIIAIMWITAYLCTRGQLVTERVEKKQQTQVTELPQGKIRLFATCGLLASIPSLVVLGLFYNGVVEVIPSILSSSYGLSASVAALLDSIIPIVGMSGVFICNFVYRLVKRNEVRGGLIFMALSIIPVAVMLFMALLGRGGYVFGQYADAVIFLIAYGLIYVFQLAFNHMMISLMAMRFSKFSLAATASGLMNAINYGGSAISTYGMSYAVNRLPLYGTVMIWLGCLLVACTALLVAQKQWTAFSKKEKFI